MKIKIQYHAQPEYLQVKMRGKWNETYINMALDEIKAEADRQGFKRLLVDLLEMSRPNSEMARFLAGEHLAKIMPYPYKVTAFAKSEDINKFGETVAVNRGAWFRVFSDEQTAIEWIMEGVQQPP